MFTIIFDDDAASNAMNPNLFPSGSQQNCRYSDSRRKKVLEEISVAGTGRSGVSSCRLLSLLEVPTVQVERYRAEVFCEKPTRITINKESEFGPLGKHFRELLKGYPQ